MPRGYSYGTVFGRRVYGGTDLVIASSPAPAYGIASQYRPPDPLIALVRCRLGSSKTKIRPELQLFCDSGLFRSGKAGISARNRSKSAAKRPVFALREQERVPNRKKLQRSRNFCFYKGRTDPAGQTLRKTRGAQRILRKTRGIAVTATRQVSARKISGSSPSSRYCPSFLAIQTRGFKVIAPLLISRVLVLSALIRAVAAGFLLLGEQCVLCRIACKK